MKCMHIFVSVTGYKTWGSPQYGCCDLRLNLKQNNYLITTTYWSFKRWIREEKYYYDVSKQAVSTLNYARLTGIIE